jgi:hypothetical protein
MMIHMCMNVRGFLRNAKFPKDFKSMFHDDSGRVLTPDEARDHLFDEVAKGHHVIPMAGHCRNPCSQPSCKGFDYGENGGCPGHN